MFDEIRKDVRRAHAHDNPEAFINNTRDGLANQIVKVESSPTEALRQIPDDQVTLYFSSYPYFCAKDYGRGEQADNIPYTDQLDFFRSIGVEQFRTLRPGGRAVINNDSVTSRDNGERQTHYKRPLVADLTNLMRDAGFLYMQEHLWDKCNHTFQNLNWGTYISPECPVNIRNWEHVLVFSKPNLDNPNRFHLPEMPDCAGPDITKDEYEEWMRGIWRIPIECRDLGGHPCPFPEKLAERVIKIHSYVGDWVVDPFCGSGTTTAVAHRLHRRWTGIDREAAFCEFARQRTEDANPTNPKPAEDQDDS